MKLLTYILLLWFLVHFSCTSTAQSQIPMIDTYIKEMMTLHSIPGVALGIIREGKIIHKNYYGKASLVFDVDVHENHLFRVYSTTKLLVSTATFQLAEQGALSIEDDLSKHLDNLPEKWQGVQIKHLLTHTSGVPNFIRFDGKLSNEEVWEKLIAAEMSFAPANGWEYNQTNYWLLANIIEAISGQTLQGYLMTHHFAGDKDGFLLSSNSVEVIPNRVSKYDFDQSNQKFYFSVEEDQSRGFAGNGLNITLDKFIDWNMRFDRNEIINEKSKMKMWSPHGFEQVRVPFLHGWGNYSFDAVKSFGFTGGGVSAFRKYIDQDLTIILLTNGYRYTPIHNDIVNEVAGMIDPTTLNLATSLQSTLLNSFLAKSFEEALATFREMKNKYPDQNFESTLNRTGYIYLRNNQLDQAIDIFILNTKSYPSSSNTYDSLGEAYFVKGDLELALVNYQKALEMDPTSTNAQRMIRMIKKQ